MEETTLLDNDAARERILLIGQPGSGKTYQLCALADTVQLHNPSAHCYVLDADRGFGKVYKSEWPQISNLSYYLARSWDDVTDFMAEVQPKQKAGDWIMIDMINRFWEMAQALEVGSVHGISPGQAMLKARRSMVEQAKLQAPGSLPQPDWTVIKRFHNDEFIDRIMVGWDANVVATTGMEKLDTERDDSLLVSVFARYGYKPDGEKRNAHRFDTVVFMEKDGRARRMTTAKDRGRLTVDGAEFGMSLWETYTDHIVKQGFTFDSL